MTDRRLRKRKINHDSTTTSPNLLQLNPTKRPKTESRILRSSTSSPLKSIHNIAKKIHTKLTRSSSSKENETPEDSQDSGVNPEVEEPKILQVSSPNLEISNAQPPKLQRSITPISENTLFQTYSNLLTPSTEDPNSIYNLNQNSSRSTTPNALYSTNNLFLPHPDKNVGLLPTENLIQHTQIIAEIDNTREKISETKKHDNSTPNGKRKYKKRSTLWGRKKQRNVRNSTKAVSEIQPQPPQINSEPPTETQTRLAIPVPIVPLAHSNLPSVLPPYAPVCADHPLPSTSSSLQNFISNIQQNSFQTLPATTSILPESDSDHETSQLNHSMKIFDFAADDSRSKSGFEHDTPTPDSGQDEGQILNVMTESCMSLPENLILDSEKVTPVKEIEAGIQGQEDEETSDLPPEEIELAHSVTPQTAHDLITQVQPAHPMATADLNSTLTPELQSAANLSSSQ